MNKKQITELLFYIAADFDVSVTEERVKVWFDQFAHVSHEDGIAAARFSLARKSYGFPRVHEFHEALAEIAAARAGDEDWGTAWDTFVRCAQKGWYLREENLKSFETLCPLGARAMGTSHGEYYHLALSEMGTFKAQFRQRYEQLCARHKANSTLSPDMKRAVNQSAVEKVEFKPERAGNIALKIVSGIRK